MIEMIAELMPWNGVLLGWGDRRKVERLAPPCCIDANCRQ